MNSPANDIRPSLKTLCKRWGITITCKPCDKLAPEWCMPGSTPWRVTLRYDKRRLTVDFYTGPAITSEPSAADVLACLVSDTFAGEDSFEAFCSEFAYSEDSIRARNTWNACHKLGPRVRRFLGDAFAAVASAEY